MSDEPATTPNGGAEATEASGPHLLITVTDPITFALRLTGDVPSLDYALNMLAQATREYESQWRLQRAAVYQQQQMRALQEAQIRADLQRRQ